MPFTSLKLLLYSGIAVSLAGLLLRYDYLSQKVESQKIELSQKNLDLRAISDTLESERESLRLTNINRNNYILQLGSAENEIKTLRARVDSGAARLRINATCEHMPSTTTDTTRDTESAPRLTEDAKQAYFDLLSELQQCPAQLNLCIKTLQGDRK